MRILNEDNKVKKTTFESCLFFIITVIKSMILNLIMLLTNSGTIENKWKRSLRRTLFHCPSNGDFLTLSIVSFVTF